MFLVTYNKEIIEKMVRRCAIPHCKSGYRGKENENDKVSIFSVPKDQYERMKWAQILSCSLSDKLYVCEIHFDPMSIKREKIASHNGILLYKHIYKQKRLIAGALPIQSNKYPLKRLKMNPASTDPQSAQASILVLNDIDINANAIDIDIDIDNLVY
ncbi:uncharacterized protein LOC113562066 [Ooceraea biroi]|uniref:uncharacterized protein LOC113562066 n=1 Tax=Ooceraea biroi TaxID=2015173 RepID=UPI000F07E967|nr:uncharacterized protein LOC113562066 [Ooceraea biroi]